MKLLKNQPKKSSPILIMFSKTKDKDCNKNLINCKIMKKLFYASVIVAISCIAFFACTKDSQDIISKKNTLSLITNDIKSKKYYPDVKNKYDYSSVNFKKFINRNTDLVNNIKTESNENTELARVNSNVTLDEYKEAVINFYSNTEHTSEEINAVFDKTLAASEKYGNDYKTMLDDLVKSGKIPQEEEDIILDYIDKFFTTETFAEFSQIATTYTYYVNNSDFTELEKRGMLTIFDTFKENKDLLEKANTEFKFLQLLQSGDIDGAATGRRSGPNAGIKCAGDVMVPMLLGAVSTNGLGFVCGFAAGMWSAYSNGCMD